MLTDEKSHKNVSFYIFTFILKIPSRDACEGRDERVTASRQETKPAEQPFSTNKALLLKLEPRAYSSTHHNNYNNNNKKKSQILISKSSQMSRQKKSGALGFGDGGICSV